MGFVRRVPESVGQLHDNITKLAENKSHISSVKVNESNNHIEVDLDWSANHMGGDAGKDFYLPIKRGKLREAKDLVDRMMSGTHAPSRSDAQTLYDLIDPQGS